MIHNNYNTNTPFDRLKHDIWKLSFSVFPFGVFIFLQTWKKNMFSEQTPWILFRKLQSHSWSNIRIIAIINSSENHALGSKDWNSSLVVQRSSLCLMLAGCQVLIFPLSYVWDPCQSSVNAWVDTTPWLISLKISHFPEMLDPEWGLSLDVLLIKELSMCREIKKWFGVINTAVEGLSFDPR